MLACTQCICWLYNTKIRCLARLYDNFQTSFLRIKHCACPCYLNISPLRGYWRLPDSIDDRLLNTVINTLVVSKTPILGQLHRPYGRRFWLNYMPPLGRSLPPQDFLNGWSEGEGKGVKCQIARLAIIIRCVNIHGCRFLVSLVHRNRGLIAAPTRVPVKAKTLSIAKKWWRLPERCAVNPRITVA
jgi:hypothetical protein